MPPSGEQADAGPYAREREVAIAAAEAAGELIRSRFNGTYAVRAKGPDGDIVTDLDVASEELILGRLRGHFPGERILSEEAGLLDAPGQRTWLVDPLDGTNNVAIGLAAYAVGIGLCLDGAPVLGVVHDPATGGTWHAELGRGAYGGAGRLGGPPGPVPEAGPLVAWTQGHRVRRDDAVAVELRGALERRSRRLIQLWAPLLGWTMLARGAIDGFVGFCAEGIDFPAGALLASESGVEFRTLTGGPFRVGFAGPDSTRSFVAARAETLEYLLDLVKPAAASLPAG